MHTRLQSTCRGANRVGTTGVL